VDRTDLCRQKDGGFTTENGAGAKGEMGEDWEGTEASEDNWLFTSEAHHVGISPQEDRGSTASPVGAGEGAGEEGGLEPTVNDDGATEMPDEVSNERLKATDVPPVTESWNAIGGFALTLDGYQVIGQRECGQLANRVKSEFARNTASLQSLSLTELRACLFFEQRRFHHFGWEPQGPDRIYVNALLEAIQGRV